MIRQRNTRRSRCLPSSCCHSFVEISIQWSPKLRLYDLPHHRDPEVTILILLAQSSPNQAYQWKSSLPHDRSAEVGNKAEGVGKGTDAGARGEGKGTALNRRGGGGAEAEAAAAQRTECPSCRDGEGHHT